MMRQILIIGALILIVNACRVGPRYARNDFGNTKNIYQQTDSMGDTLMLMPWFDLYEDRVLKELIQRALDNNFDLKAAVARVEQARSVAAIVKADLGPAVGYRIGANTTDVGGQNPSDALIARKHSANDIAGTLSWEIDVFGRIRNAQAAAINQYLEQEALYRNFMVILVAEVADQYFLLRDLDNRLLIAEHTLDVRKEALRINSERFTKGYSPEIDMQQAIVQVEAIEAFIPNTKRQIVRVENALNQLCGRTAGAILRGRPNDEQVLPPTIPPGLPSHLLERRPDIQAAEFALRAQYDRIGVAQAERLPLISLTGFLGVASPQLSTLISAQSVYSSIAGGLAGPIFAFNRNVRKVTFERQRAVEFENNYNQVVLNAFMEVENSLNDKRNFDIEYEARMRQVKAARKALELSRQRYDIGYTTYLEVLTQENILFETEILESITLRLKHSAVVNLYKALGGGW